MKKIITAILVLLFLSCSAAYAESPAKIMHTADIQRESWAGKTVILHSGDVQGVVTGYARMAGLKNLLLQAGAEVILADAGNFSQGTIYASHSKGASAIRLMNAAGYNVVTLGNHEFDFGTETLAENIRSARFSVVCANVIRNDTGNPLVDSCTTVTTESGLKLGFFGLITPEAATKITPANISGLDFFGYGCLDLEAQIQIDALRSSGCSLVFGLTSLGTDSAPETGFRSTDLYSKVQGADMFIDGRHSFPMTEGENGEQVQSAGGRLQYIGVIVIDNATASITDHFVVPAEDVAPDPEISALAQEITEETDRELGATFAECDASLNGKTNPGSRTEETNLGDLITDALIWYAKKNGCTGQSGSQGTVAVLNGGAIRSGIDAGEISLKDIESVLPFDNTVSVLTLTGRDLLEALEASCFAAPDPAAGFPQTSGFLWTLDTSREYARGSLYYLDSKETGYYAPAAISRVSIQSVNGSPFDPDALYTVVTNDFCAAGGDTYNVFSRAGTGRIDTGFSLSEAVSAYISEALDGKITSEQYGAPAGRMTLSSHLAL